VAQKHFRIGFDLDDVLLGTADVVTSLYSDKYGADVTRDDWYDYESIDKTWQVGTKTQLNSRLINLNYSDDYVNVVKALRDSQRVLRDLKDAGHTLSLVTGRPESSRIKTYTVLSRLFSGVFSNEDLYFTDHYNHDGHKSSKADVAVRLGLTHFIDDLIEHADIVAAEGIKTILFSDNYKWNQTAAKEGIIRLNSWQEIEKFFYDEQQRI